MKLTINYVYSNGKAAKPSIVRTYSAGYKYDIKSPVITACVPDKDRVSGILTEDTEVTVTYTELKYTLTVKYTYLNGVDAAPTRISQLSYKERYNIESPIISGYSPSKNIVTGTMPARDVIITIFYNENTPNIIEDLDTPL